MVAAGISFSP